MIVRLGGYVCRVDAPRTGRVCHIGKGTDNRVVAHLNAVIEAAADFA